MDTESVETVYVRVSHAAKIVWEGEALSVSSENSDGPFDILPFHAHFISIILDKPIVINLLDGTTKEYNYSQSVIHVKNDKVSIYADIYGEES